jgi:hypothetical protein
VADGCVAKNGSYVDEDEVRWQVLQEIATVQTYS